MVLWIFAFMTSAPMDIHLSVNLFIISRHRPIAQYLSHSKLNYEWWRQVNGSVGSAEPSKVK